jgi:hypothetical protein
VWPNPRPEIIGTQIPQAATIGAIKSDVLSPTPPVECLSAFGLSMAEKSRVFPECSMASVSVSCSESSMPLR